MIPTRLLLLAMVAVLSAASATAADPEATIGRAKPSEKHRGVSWVAGEEVEAADFQPLIDNNVSWIVQTPFGWQRNVDTPEVRLITSGRVYWGETDKGIEVTTKLARQRGLKTLLKPHLWLTRAEPGKWRTHIAMKTEEDWQSWFSSYREFILHYAQLAERLQIEALCIGTELHATVVQKPQAWRRLIALIRSQYSGQLTYAANWYEEFEEVPFWNELDFVGIQAYFPLGQKTSPTVDELTRAWQPHLGAIKRLHQQVGRRVLFTEVGYKSTPGSTIEPWTWPRGMQREVDLDTQARAYEAFFQTFWDKTWFAGAYLWKWYPQHERAGGDRHPGFTPQNKPAQEVLARWYSSSESR